MLLKETFAPETPQTDRLADANWTPGCWSGIGSGSSQEDVHTDEIPEVSDDVVADFNEGMAKIARHSKREDLMPLTFQLSTTWKEATEKATKACEVICSVIAPKDGEKLFQAIHQPTANDLDEVTEDLIALMSAYRDAISKNVKIIILLHEKFLQFDWLRAMVFRLILKYLHVKITAFLPLVTFPNYLKFLSPNGS